MSYSEVTLNSFSSFCRGRDKTRAAAGKRECLMVGRTQSGLKIKQSVVFRKPLLLRHCSSSCGLNPGSSPSRSNKASVFPAASASPLAPIPCSLNALSACACVHQVPRTCCSRTAAGVAVGEVCKEQGACYVRLQLELWTVTCMLMKPYECDTGRAC